MECTYPHFMLIFDSIGLQYSGLSTADLLNHQHGFSQYTLIGRHFIQVHSSR